MPRAGLTRDKVVAAAADLADEVGLERLTLAELADRLGVKQPSLYKHVAGLPAVRAGVAVAAKHELADTLRRAVVGRSRDEALRALTHAYRGWAVEHPGRYAAAQTAPDPSDPDDVAASEAAAAVVVDALRGYHLDEGRAVDAVRTLRALVHGYVTLEAAGGFGLPRAVDESLDWALTTLHDALGRSAQA